MSSSAVVLGSESLTNHLGALPQGTTLSSQEATNGSMSHMMQELGDSFVKFQITVMAVEQKSSQSRFEISDTVVSVIKTVTDEFYKAMKQVAAAKAEQNSLDGVQKVLTIVMDSLQILAATMSGNVGMAVMTAALMGMNVGGGFKKIEQDISSDLQKNQHLDANEANFVADTIVVAITIVVMVAVMALAAKATNSVSSVARSASSVEEGDEEMQEINTQQEALPADAAEAPPQTEAPAQAPKTDAPAAAPRGWKAPLALAVSQAIMNTDFASDAAKCAAGKTSENNKWKVELTVVILISLFAALTGAVAMSNLASSAKAVASTAARGVGSAKSFSQLLTQARASLETFSTSESGTKLFKAVNIVNGAALVAQSSSDIVQGTISLRLADLAEQSAVAQSDSEQYKGLLKQSQTAFTNYLNEANSELQGINQELYAVGTAFTAANAQQARMSG